MMGNFKKNNITNNFYSDEWYTSKETVEFMYKLLNIKSVEREITIMCPYDTENSYFVKVAKEFGYNVIYNIRDFLEKDYEYDYLITNPPFSIKDLVLEKCIKDRKRCCLILPITTLSGVKRHKLFKENNYLLNVFIPTRRVIYYNEKWEKQKGCSFESIFMILDPKIKQSKVIFEYELEKELKL